MRLVPMRSSLAIVACVAVPAFTLAAATSSAASVTSTSYTGCGSPGASQASSLR